MESAFPADEIVFNHALAMRDLVHGRHQEADLFTGHALVVHEKAKPDGNPKNEVGVYKMGKDFIR